MDRPRLALLNASTNEANTRRNFRRELDADLVEFPVRQESVPETFDFDGVVVTGSSASVYEDKPWIHDLLDWLETAVERGIPHLGVCFGHQALATALGGAVEPMGAYEIGYRKVRQIGDSPLFNGIDDVFTVFTTHQDTVTELPPGAELIAENDFGIHGFERGAVFTVQFHPEYDFETAVELTEKKDLSDEQRREVRARLTEANYAAACEVKHLFDNFTQYTIAARELADLSV